MTSSHFSSTPNSPPVGIGGSRRRVVPPGTGAWREGLLAPATHTDAAEVIRHQRLFFLAFKPIPHW